MQQLVALLQVLLTLYLGPVAGGAAGSMTTELANQIRSDKPIDAQSVLMKGVEGAFWGSLSKGDTYKNLAFYGQYDKSRLIQLGVPPSNAGFIDFQYYLNRQGASALKSTITETQNGF